MGSIFISYRREDSEGEALHLCNDLKAKLGSDRVFMDVTGIDPGKDFRKVIENAVTTCDALIVMIGRKWIDAADEEGNRRLESPKDFVRIETAAALQRDIPVIPVLVQGAAMPRPEQLPPDIEALTWRNAFELRHSRWSVDVTELISGLRKTLPTLAADAPGEIPSRPWWRTASGSLATGGLIVAVIGGIALQQAGAFDEAQTIPHGPDQATATKTAVIQPNVEQPAPERQNAVTAGVQQEATKQLPVWPDPVRQDAVRPEVEPPQNRISLVGSWRGSPTCALEIYKDDGETIEGSCDVGGDFHTITGSYMDPTHITTTITRTDSLDCVVSAKGSIVIRNRDTADFNQAGWRGCDQQTGSISQRLSRQ